jgi:hypothetical protein
MTLAVGVPRKLRPEKTPSINTEVFAFSVSSSAMNFFSIRPIVLDLIFILLCSSVVQSKRCSNPSVRREWNSLSETQRAEWITAVKVCVLYHPDSPLTKRTSSA